MRDGLTLQPRAFFLSVDMCIAYTTAPVNRLLLNFEKATGLGSTYAARLLGVAYPTYAQYRSERRELPLYHSKHIEVLLLLSRANLEKVMTDGKA